MTIATSCPAVASLPSYYSILDTHYTTLRLVPLRRDLDGLFFSGFPLGAVIILGGLIGLDRTFVRTVTEHCSGS